MVEVWKPLPVPEFSHLYSVSNFGRVRVEDRIVKNQHNYYVRVGRMLSLSNNGDGYKFVWCNRTGVKSRMFYVHRLVAQAFLPNAENKPEVNHLDGDKANNSVENLQWSTRLENYNHAIANGLLSKDGINYCFA